MISFKVTGSFDNTDRFLKTMSEKDIFKTLDVFGQQGVQALANNTPQDTGTTARSWTYKIVNDKTTHSIVWSNTNVNDGVNIAIIIQYGHGTRNGAYIQGIDYINPAILPLFEQIVEGVWREVTTA